MESPDRPAPSRAAAPSSAAVSRRMSRQRTRDTAPEKALRVQLHRLGLRYRIHSRPPAGKGREIDVLFVRARVAVFVDGCYWHGCPDHSSWPRANEAFWRAKIEGNRARDTVISATLSAAGWRVVRVWEHEAAGEAATRIAAIVHQRGLESR
jgi:DNA mismatch endonuclease (patch repair protein)